MTVELFVPPFLQARGYCSLAPLVELARRALDDRGRRVHPWHAWRGLLEYLSCVEQARECLLGLPTGRSVGSVDVVPARYHSIGLVFVAQALFDNLAEWLRANLQLKVRHTCTAFHKAAFASAVEARDMVLAQTLAAWRPFIESLERYRHSWIHRLAGGAHVFVDRDSPAVPNATVSINVPIDPRIDVEAPAGDYIRMVDECKANNAGRWLLPIDEFANTYGDGARDFILQILSRSLVLLR